ASGNGRIAFTSDRDGNAEIYLMDADGSNPVRLTFTDAPEDNAAISPDGRKIAFGSARDGNWEIYVMGVDGSNQVRLTNNTTDDAYPTWSPDGKQIAFQSWRDGNSEIYTMYADGYGQANVTKHPAEDWDASWSPDGKKLAFSSTRDGNWEIYVTAADGGDAPQQESVWVDDATPAGATLAGDGEGWNWIGTNPMPYSGTLAHQSNVVAGIHQHYFYGATQTLSVNVGDRLFAYVYLDPDNMPAEIMLQWNNGDWDHRAYWGQNHIPWGVDGTASRRYMGPIPEGGSWVRLEVPASLVGLEGSALNGMAFSMSGGRATWDRAGRTLSRLTNGPAADWAPAWSPDGQQIAFTTSRDSNYEIYKMNADGGTQTRLTFTLEYDDEAAWSPNGKYITFQGDETGNSEVYVMENDGSAVTNVTNNFVWDYRPSWRNVGTPPTPGHEAVWVEDSTPAGAILYGDGEGWNWINANPAPFSAALAHQSNVVGGAHQHFFVGATETLTVGAGDKLFSYVYLDPANPPSEVMLQWNDGIWEHRAYWGANIIPWGVDGTESRRYMGPLPPAGQWVRLEVAANMVGLEGRTLNGMAFTLYGGRATWDRAGKSFVPAPTNDHVWVEDGIPLGATPHDEPWNWINSNPTPFSGTAAHQSPVTPGTHQSYFQGATQTFLVSPGDTLFAYVYLDPANPPSEVMIQWNNGHWEHRAYWGANLIGWGVDGTESRRHMGPLPPAGQWVRLEVPASAVGLEGSTLNGLAFTLYNGRATWDRAGKSSTQPPPFEGVWVEDRVPEGAALAGDGEGWNWTSANPTPFSGTVAPQSNVVGGVHQHYFYGATE
ncbi:MAG TPA: hypothetical protein VGV38_23710, partial [Pyrinomonadaceae bacterium]|nr:hypothetical protein [Pyrinomonadaceae bacterium]